MEEQESVLGLAKNVWNGGLMQKQIQEETGRLCF